MPEICECFIHFQHSHHVLVKELGLGCTGAHNWTLLGLSVDATDEEAGMKKSPKLSGLTDNHANGYLDQIDGTCRLMRGQKDNQTWTWPGTVDSPEELEGLALCRVSYTPRSLILRFGRLDLQVCIIYLSIYLM